MDFNSRTPEMNRLFTFYRTKLPEWRSISNSPAKFAKAGFSRSENAQTDEVTCEMCHITYSNWDGESPFAVHIVLNHQCLFLNTPSADDAIQSHPRVEEARHRWFPADSDTNDHTNDSGYDSRLDDSDHFNVSVLSREASFPFPFSPKVGDMSMMLASRRHKTFTDTNCRLSIKWAEQGFVFKSDTGEVQCVFCAVVFPFDSFDVQQMHAENSVLCPLVLMKDVGNVTRAEEERIRHKHLLQQLQKKESQQSFAVSHPQYEEESRRAGTYENWPHGLYVEELQASEMTEAGFFYTGCADKVRCFYCGLGLHQWKPGSKPWEQHALHMPACPLVQAKGHHLAQQAAQAQILTVADFPTHAKSSEAASNTGHVLTSTPGSLTMDVSAVNAALNTSRFPTKDILIGQLRANDANFTDLCKQRHLNYQKDQELQNKDQVIQNKDQVIQNKDQQLQVHREELQLQRQVVVSQDEELQQKERELQILLAYMERRISSLQAQLAERGHGGQEAAAHQAAQGAAAAAEVPADTGRMTCKVCLSAEMNTVFKPCCHITCCDSCAQQLVGTWCPVCRAAVHEILPVYIP
ncbi:baculoviral IAP repeat-containing protein 3-like isoform X2 [Babylonia areolata]|uniref:baculoviral IAP repeat-containing protein 3-like isoform X2 n=1 Tax=Babylonia areolata TaxID=304850 RepID=UPI003FD431F5